MQLLKQSTAATVLIGPVLDSTGAAYTGMVIGDFNITKNGTTAAMASAAAVTHSHNGMYLLDMTTGNTDTAGRLAVSSNKATYAMAPFRASVLVATVFDALITNATTAAGGLGDIQRMAGTALTARDIGASVLLSVGTGTGQVNLSSGAVPIQAGTGTGQLDFTSGVVKANTTQLAGSSTPVTNMGTVFNTDFATNYDATNKAFLAKLGNFAMGGSSLALTTGAIACTTITASGAVAFQSTFAVTTSTSLGALSCTTLTASGAVAFQSTFAVTTSTSLAALSATTITASGTTSIAAVTTSGTVTLNALTVINATTLSGAVSLGSTLGITGTTTLAALTTSGTVTFNAFTVTNATTLSGAVSLGSTLGVTGTTTLAAVTTSGTVTLSALTVTNATTLTGAVSATNASNDIRGVVLQSGGLANITAWTVNITGSLSGSVGSVTTKTGYKLASDGLDAVLIESSIVASASLTDDAGMQLTAINARQALSLVISAAAAGVLAGAEATTVTIKPAGLPSGNTRITATVDADGNRSAITLKVPT